MNRTSLRLAWVLVPTLCAGTVAAQTTLDWSTSAVDHRGNVGHTYTFTCPAGGPDAPRLWGTDLYTDDSSICGAAVHSGLITRAAGGRVTIEIRPGANAYAGSARNGVTSGDWGAYDGSFVVVDGQGSAEDPGAGGVRTATWTTQADTLRGRNGHRFSFSCPPGGTLSDRLWGTDVYTDDSSICTAAVHAGLITVAQGGPVAVEIRPGQEVYKASTRHGVVSRDYGSWSGSFAFVEGGPVEDAAGGVRSATWTTQADTLRGRNGQRFDFACPPRGTLSDRLWGADVYTDDSSICTAAVHAGLITTADGGTVTVEIRPGQEVYKASTRHGVASRDYGSWSGSFAFVPRR